MPSTKWPRRQGQQLLFTTTDRLPFCTTTALLSTSFTIAPLTALVWKNILSSWCFSTSRILWWASWGVHPMPPLASPDWAVVAGGASLQQTPRLWGSNYPRSHSLSPSIHPSEDPTGSKISTSQTPQNGCAHISSNQVKHHSL